MNRDVLYKYAWRGCEKIGKLSKKITYFFYQNFVVASENLDYYKNDCYGTTEEKYLKSASYFATLLNQYPAPPQPPQTSTLVSTAFSRKLPNMDVPTFSGEFLDWISFSFAEKQLN